MSAQLATYLSFRGNAREALEFYHSVLGGELSIMRYDSIPGMMGDADEGDKVMHGQLDTEDGFTLMAADMPASMADSPDSAAGGSSVCVFGPDLEHLTQIWNALAEGAEIREPFAKAPWGDTFGDLRDRFGITWMVSAGEPVSSSAG